MGAIKATGIKRQLGKSDLDRLTVLVREAAQNSVDAASPDRSCPVRFSVRFERFDGIVGAAWRERLSAGAPASSSLLLREALDRDSLPILFVSDSGTTGLGGPTQANREQEHETHDYLAFLLNVGEPRDTHLGGGTFGFGKAVFFVNSRASTILVYTRCHNEDGDAETRLVGSALGESYVEGGQAYSGRHWFGLTDEGDQAIEPLRNEAADELAEQLGFELFAEDDFGTSIAMIDPELGDRNALQAAEWVASAMAWHLWPKLVAPADSSANLVCSVAVSGEVVEVPDPRAHRILRDFALAHDELDTEGKAITRYKKRIGTLRLRTGYGPPPAADELGIELGFASGVHHCCLLRGPRLVVEYRPGPPQGEESLSFAGVFLAAEEYDDSFAAAEPPTHDAWVYGDLDPTDKSVVKVALEKVDRAMREQVMPDAIPFAEGDESGGLAGLSQQLGSLLAPAPGGGASKKSTGGGGGRRRVSTLGDPAWTTHEGQDVLAQRFSVDVGTSTVTVTANSAVGVWGGGGRESAAPQGESVPELIGWRSPTGEVHLGELVAIGPAEVGEWEALVSPPPEAVVRVSVREAHDENAGG